MSEIINLVDPWVDTPRINQLNECVPAWADDEPDPAGLLVDPNRAGLLVDPDPAGLLVDPDPAGLLVDGGGRLTARCAGACRRPAQTARRPLGR